MAFCLKKDEHHETKTRIYLGGEAMEEGEPKGAKTVRHT